MQAITNFIVDYCNLFTSFHDSHGKFKREQFLLWPEANNIMANWFPSRWFVFFLSKFFMTREDQHINPDRYSDDQMYPFANKRSLPSYSSIKPREKDSSCCDDATELSGKTLPSITRLLPHSTVNKAVLWGIWISKRQLNGQKYYCEPARSTLKPQKNR